jgi:hypothetical protein
MHVVETVETKTDDDDDLNFGVVPGLYLACTT